MIPKLSGACYTVRLLVCDSNFNIHKSIYCAYIHPVIKYGIFFGVTLPAVRRLSLYKIKS
jgi:hypothetical protein